MNMFQGPFFLQIKLPVASTVSYKRHKKSKKVTFHTNCLSVLLLYVLLLLRCASAAGIKPKATMTLLSLSTARLLALLARRARERTTFAL
jgi:hypothetical protein